MRMTGRKTHADDEADYVSEPIGVAEMAAAAEREALRIRDVQGELRSCGALRSATADQRRRIAVHMATARLLRKLEPHMPVIRRMLRGQR